MKLRCAGFVHSPKHSEMWLACPRAPLRGDRFCAEHRDALDGAVMAIFMSGFHDENSDVSKRAKRARKSAGRKGSRPVRAWKAVVHVEKAARRADALETAEAPPPGSPVAQSAS